jgi:16S rRNA (guanine527-N7)-methyltransferase
MSMQTSECVVSLGREWHLSVDKESADRVSRFMSLLLRWNERLNLTGARGLGDLCGEHLVDSFVLSRLCPPSSVVVDVGSGGGLPALPFAILRPDCRVTLVEPRAKRVAFLHSAVRECGLDSVVVLRSRAEDLDAACCSVAASRATFKPETWLAMAGRLLVEEGRAVVFSVAPAEVSRGLARVVDSIKYRTAAGAPRWSGSYCFT